jgi:hypothetical protein
MCEIDVDLRTVTADKRRMSLEQLTRLLDAAQRTVREYRSAGSERDVKAGGRQWAVLELEHTVRRGYDGVVRADLRIRRANTTRSDLCLR